MKENYENEKSVRGKLYSPTGVPIVGSDELIPGTALIAAVRLLPSGKYEIEFTGTTEEFYELQYTNTRDGEDLYIDDEGNLWKESDLVFRPAH